MGCQQYNVSFIYELLDQRASVFQENKENREQANQAGTGILIRDLKGKEYVQNPVCGFFFNFFEIATVQTSELSRYNGKRNESRQTRLAREFYGIWQKKYRLVLSGREGKNCLNCLARMNETLRFCDFEIKSRRLACGQTVGFLLHNGGSLTEEVK